MDRYSLTGTLFALVKAYLTNFEAVILETTNHKAISRIFDTLGHIVDSVQKILVQVRGTKQPRKTGNRKKEVSPHEGADYVLIWDDLSTRQLIGDKKDCVHIAENLWNIANQLLATSDSPASDSDARGIAADVFAASHDFCILSEEELGMSLSKDHLDFDIKNIPSKQTKVSKRK